MIIRNIRSWILVLLLSQHVIVYDFRRNKRRLPPRDIVFIWRIRRKLRFTLFITSLQSTLFLLQVRLMDIMRLQRHTKEIRLHVHWRRNSDLRRVLVFLWRLFRHFSIVVSKNSVWKFCWLLNLNFIILNVISIVCWCWVDETKILCHNFVKFCVRLLSTFDITKVSNCRFWAWSIVWLIDTFISWDELWI